jgi:hypothetical protein
MTNIDTTDTAFGEYTAFGQPGAPTEPAAVTTAATPAPLEGGGGGGRGSQRPESDARPGGGGRGTGGGHHLTVVPDDHDGPDRQALEHDRAQIAAIEAKLAGQGVVLLSEMRRIAQGALPPKPTPTLGRIQGSTDAIFYAGKSNAIVGEAGKGKSSITKHVLIEVATDGRNCLLIDREKTWIDFAHSMDSLGCTDAAAERIAYMKPKSALRDLTPGIVSLIRNGGVELIVIDSMNRDLSAASCHENDNDHVRAWYDQTVEPLLEAGATVIWVDHMRKPDEYRGRPVQSGGRSAKGAIAKLEVLTGTNIVLETARPFSRKQAGTVKLRATKDNNGAHTEGTVIAEAHVTPGEDGSMEIELKAPERHLDADGNFRPTALMERISIYLERFGAEARSKSQIQQEVLGKENFLAQAADKLVEEGFATKEPGPRNAQLFRFVRPFTDLAKSTTSDSVAPTGLDGVGDWALRPAKDDAELF